MQIIELYFFDYFRNRFRIACKYNIFKKFFADINSFGGDVILGKEQILKQGLIGAGTFYKKLKAREF